MKITWLRFLMIAAAGALAGALLLWSGLINIGASTGHWRLTSWLLNIGMRQSVEMHASSEPPADLADPALVRRGAGYYETGCAYCHGSPGRPRGAVPRAMTPEAPDLTEKIAEWTPEELFWIVKNGIKFTAMPAWPTQERDDEVWSMVAFLLRMTDLTREEYQALAFGDLPAFDPLLLVGETDNLIANCQRCHGANGRGDPNGAFPRLDIQNEATLLYALESYSDGRRASGIMQAATRELGPEELAELASYYARAEGDVPALRPDEVDPTLLARGEKIAAEGVPEQDVAACSACHAPGAARGRDVFPVLDGQYPGYLEDQLALFASEEAQRGGGRFAELMQQSAHTLEPDDIIAVAAWYASRQPPSSEAGPE